MLLLPTRRPIRDKEHNQIDFVLADGDSVTDLVEVKLSDLTPNAYLHRMAGWKWRARMSGWRGWWLERSWLSDPQAVTACQGKHCTSGFAWLTP
jgi:hypothetical protein